MEKDKLKRLFIGFSFWVFGSVWNYFLFPLGGFFGDWINLGRWFVYIGDIFYIISFSIILSVVWK
ncbi:MAG: hypothetical protein GYA14_11505 [Ignavibacteria bacterium]|nr:hypothetical protein [Ignavibacteria bacterium]